MKTIKKTKAPHLTWQECLEQNKQPSVIKTQKIFTEERDKVVKGVRMLAGIHYKDDSEILPGVHNLLATLQGAKKNTVSVDFIEGMRGFMIWAAETKQDTRLHHKSAKERGF